MKIDEAFTITCRILKNHNIKFWLEAGSLLGAVREGKRISWDNDYDIAYHIKDVKKVIYAMQDIKLYGFQVHGNLYHSISYEGKHLICIQPHQIIDGHMFRIQSLLPTEYHITKLPLLLQIGFGWFQYKLRLYRKMYYRGEKEDYQIMIPKKMGNEQVYIPIGFNSVLTKKYGSWRIPYEY